jgi:hypothetical protein
LPANSGEAWKARISVSARRVPRPLVVVAVMVLLLEFVWLLPAAQSQPTWMYIRKLELFQKRIHSHSADE